MLDDWGDISPGVVAIAEDVAPPGAYAPAVVGPDGEEGRMPNAIKGRLRVGEGTNHIVLDPNDPLRMSMLVSGLERLRIGNLNGFLGYAVNAYGIAIGDAASYMKYDQANGLRISGAIQGGTIDIGGSDATSFHVDAGGNMYLGAGAFYVSAAGALSATSGVIGGFSISPTEGLYAGAGGTRVQMKPGYGMWAGATDINSAPFRVTAAGNLIASSVEITGTIHATGGSFVGGYLKNLTLGRTGVASGTLLLELAEGLGDTYIASGKMDFTNVDTGFILGLDDSDSNKPKFYIGDATKYLNWDGAALTIAGATLTGNVLTGTTADAFTINSDVQDVNADLVLGRTTGGNATLRWNGTLVGVDKALRVTGSPASIGQFSLAAAAGTVAKTWATVDFASFDSYYDNSEYRRFLDISMIGGQNGSAGGGIIRFITNPNTSDTGVERMRIGYDGLVTVTESVKVDGPNDGTTLLRLCNSTYGYDFGRNQNTGAFSLQGDQSGYNNIELAPTGGSVWIGFTGSTGGAILSINGGCHVGGNSDPGDNNLLVDGTGTITGAFGCNSKTAQTAYASGGALSTYGAGANGLDSGANMAALHALVVAIRAALVANGIMS